MMQRFLLLLVTVVLVLIRRTSKAMECATPSETKTRTFNSIVEYQANKDTFNPVTPGWRGSSVKFNDSVVIKVLEKNDFITYDSQHIIKMILTGRQIEKVNGGAFLQLDCVHELLLDHNNITEMSVDVFQGLYHLEELDLSDNQLDILSDLLFSNVPRLKVLNLSKNQISVIQPLTFKNLVLLQVLNLAWNKLTVIEPKIWIDSKKMENLNLAGNALRHFDLNYNFSFATLKILNLSRNMLTELNVVALQEHLPYLEQIDLNDNYWLCNELESMISNLNKLKIQFVSGHASSRSVQGIVCSDTPIVPKKSTAMSTTTEYQPSPDRLYIERIVEKKVKESHEKIDNSIRYLQTMVICLFVILGVFIVFEISVRTKCCTSIIRYFRGENAYIDTSHVEHFGLLDR